MDPTGVLGYTGSPWLGNGRTGNGAYSPSNIAHPSAFHDLVSMLTGKIYPVPNLTSPTGYGYYVYPDASGYLPSLSDIYGLSASPSTGHLVTGQSVAITLTMDAPLWTVSGSPTLTLNSGGTAYYSSGSGTNALVFNYVVGAGNSVAHTGRKFSEPERSHGKGRRRESGQLWPSQSHDVVYRAPR